MNVAITVSDTHLLTSIEKRDELFLFFKTQNAPIGGSFFSETQFLLHAAQGDRVHGKIKEDTNTLKLNVGDYVRFTHKRVVVCSGSVATIEYSTSNNPQ